MAPSWGFIATVRAAPMSDATSASQGPWKPRAAAPAHERTKRAGWPRHRQGRSDDFCGLSAGRQFPDPSCVEPQHLAFIFLGQERNMFPYQVKFRCQRRSVINAPPGRHRWRHSRMRLTGCQSRPAIDAAIYRPDGTLYQLQPSFHTSSTEPEPTARARRAGEEFY